MKRVSDIHATSGRVTGVDPDNVVDEYRAQNLGELSDASLYRQIAAIVASPANGRVTSFVLHAPLELIARYGLLRHVVPADRELARFQMVASAAVYGSNANLLGRPPAAAPLPDLATAQTECLSAFRNGDRDGLDALVLQVASQFGPASLVCALTPLALPTLTGASHSHIGLWLLLRHGEPTGIEEGFLLRAAARSLAAEPGAQITSFSGMFIDGTTPLHRTPADITQDVLTKLSNPERKVSRGRSIRQIIETAETIGNPDRLFGEFIRHDLTDVQIDAAFRGIMRACGHAMLQDDPNEAKFGWTHCLTLPQSAFGLSTRRAHRKLALAAALVWATSYRTTLATVPLDVNWRPARIENVSLLEALDSGPATAAARAWHAAPDEFEHIVCTLATEASIRNDIHLVKYTRACFDMAWLDPECRQLYLAAAAYLCSLWIRERPRGSLCENLLEGRSTS